jgi:hypothetical protein
MSLRDGLRDWQPAGRTARNSFENRLKLGAGFTVSSLSVSKPAYGRLFPTILLADCCSSANHQRSLAKVSKNTGHYSPLLQST